MNLINLENSISNLEEEVNSLKGKVSLLSEQHEETVKELSSLKELSIINTKAIALLDLVQKSTKELIKDVFEKVTTHALTFIHQNNDYRFELEFDKRGNIPEVNYLIKTPDMQESHDILETRGGGTCDIVSLALRLILLEVSRNKGFLFLDEPEKHLDNPETTQKMIEFVKETQRDTNRQIIWITHKDEVVNAVSNPIIMNSNLVKTKQQDIIECPQNSGQLEKEDIKPKKRGRPKGSKKKKEEK